MDIIRLKRSRRKRDVSTLAQGIYVRASTYSKLPKHNIKKNRKLIRIDNKLHLGV